MWNKYYNKIWFLIFFFYVMSAHTRKLIYLFSKKIKNKNNVAYIHSSSTVQQFDTMQDDVFIEYMYVLITINSYPSLAN